MNTLFEYEQYMPHGMCLLWEPWLVLLWSGSDLMIFTAYMAIPLAIIMVLRKRPDLAHRGLVTLFAGFILLCGVTHALSIVTLWTPIYPLVGTVKLATGLISLATALVLFRLIPAFIRIPTPDRHEEVIAQLETTLADLSRTRDELETRVKSRTAELDRANQQLRFTARDAVQRSRNLIQMVSSLTRPGAEVNDYPANFLSELRGRINALAIATSTVMEQGENSRASVDRIIRRQIEPLFAKPAQQLMTQGDEVSVGAQGAQQLSLVAWELASRIAQMGRTEQKTARITVKWWVTRKPGEEDRFTLEWRETTAPKVEAVPSVPGDEAIGRTPDPLDEFSETLLTRIIPRLLDGEGRVDVAPSTFVYQLACPLSALDNSRETPSEKHDEELLGGAAAVN